MSNWEATKRYRFRAVQWQIEKNPKTGTQAVQCMLEVSSGPNAGSRMRWRGYLNSPANQQTTVEELKVMGWKGLRLGDWSGMGSKEFEASALPEVNDGKTYWRAAFPRPVPVLKTENVVKDDELAALNASMAGLLGAAPGAGAPLPPPPVAAEGNGTEEIPF